MGKKICTLILDPPVGPYDPPEKLRDWARELEQMLQDYADNPDSLEAVEYELQQARRWLDDPRAQQYWKDRERPEKPSSD